MLQFEEGPSLASKREYSFFVRYWFTRRVKASHATQTRHGGLWPACTPAVILFIALPETESKTDPG